MIVYDQTNMQYKGKVVYLAMLVELDQIRPAPSSANTIDMWSCFGQSVAQSLRNVTTLISYFHV